MRLARSNDDPKLLADLERLAGREPVPAPEPAPVPDAPALGAPVAVSGPAAAIAAMDDSFVRRFVAGAVHLRRYAPFYAGGGLWLLALLLIQPVGGGDGRSSQLAEPAGVRRGTVATATSGASEQAAPVATPVFDDFGGSSFVTDGGSGFDEGPSFTDDSEFTTSDGVDGAGSSVDSFDSFESFEGEDAEATSTPLSIVSSGYASSTGGTPLEQQPQGGGLPVTAAGGQTTRYSFFRLGGDDSTLRLKEAAGGVAADSATIRLCPLASGDWKPGPAQPMSAAPKIDESALCASGTRTGDGIWTFDVFDFLPVDGGNGFALVPTGTASTFQVVFEPVALPPQDASEG